MAVGLSAAEANAIVDGLDGLYIQLHTADPGAAGTTAAATETTRKQVSLAAASGGAASTDAALEWTSVAASRSTPTIRCGRLRLLARLNLGDAHG